MSRRVRSVLLVDDDASLLRGWCSRLRRRIDRVLTATDKGEALAIASEQPVDLAIVDQRLGCERGSAVAAELLTIQPTLQVFLTSAALDLDDAYEAGRLQIGFFSKPPDLVPVIDAIEAGRDPRTFVHSLDSLSMESVSRRHIGRVLDLVDGNESRAAKILSLSRSGLRLKVRKLGLARPRRAEARTGFKI